MNKFTYKIPQVRVINLMEEADCLQGVSGGVHTEGQGEGTTTGGGGGGTSPIWEWEE